MTRGILILSHQGFSFLEDVIKEARNKGLNAFVLMSKPSPASMSRINVIEPLVDFLKVTGTDNLRIQDVEGVLTELSKNYAEPLAVISVWEGYRVLMAEANRKLGANDQSPRSLARILDKYLFRKTLQKAGLSRVRTRRVTAKNMSRILNSGKDNFLKPRHGLASFGAFRVGRGTKVAMVKGLQREMAQDPEYRGIFGKEVEFIAEDYIPGIEFSFEIIAINNSFYLLATHEKMEVEEQQSSTLENLCVSPPISLSKNEVRRAEKNVISCLKALGIQNGCYHVEAKFDFLTGRWEIIEVNPRVGGAMIKESVRITSNGGNLISLWMDSLLAKTPRQRNELRTSLRNYAKNRGSVTSMFRVYFGTPGLKIKSIVQNKKVEEPFIFKVHAKAGDQLPKSSREIFLGQALWKIKNCGRDAKIERLSTLSKSALEVKYEH